MAAAPSGIEINTPQGLIRLALLPKAAPDTCQHIARLIQGGLYDGTSFYRSDFVIQFGLHGTKTTNPFPDLTTNETSTGDRVSNARGTMSVAHFDVPDCGNSEIFINLRDNPHLDSAYGGYCCFARIAEGDRQSFATVDKIAEIIAASPGARVAVSTCRCLDGSGNVLPSARNA